MPKVILTPTSSHSGSGTNVAGLSSILTAVNAGATTAVSSPTRAHLEFTITGPSNSFGSATFIALTASGRYVSLATLNVSANGPKTAAQDVSLPSGVTSISTNVDSLIPGVGAVPSMSVTT